VFPAEQQGVCLCFSQHHLHGISQVPGMARLKEVRQDGLRDEEGGGILLPELIASYTNQRLSAKFNKSGPRDIRW